eukprot:m.92380 g.92380  ORF g.92380 m.92380 type:complete len:67 (+) comp8510_c0_seq1:899-1099(+)
MADALLAHLTVLSSDSLLILFDLLLRWLDLTSGLDTWLMRTHYFILFSTCSLPARLHGVDSTHDGL